MPVKAVIGLQYGDEGKGKFVDILAQSADAVVRYQGGNNAGHTIFTDNKKFILHSVPSGIVSKKECIIGPGVVLNLEELDKELRELGSDAKKLISIDFRTHLIMPYHIEMDKLKEEKDTTIGTTLRGIGPCYTDKVSRRGIRIEDLYNEKILLQKIEANLKEKNKIFKENNKSIFDPKEIYKKLLYLAANFKNNIKDVTLLLNKKIKEGKEIIMEGAQGAMLDLDFGTYPFVTSSSPCIGGVSTGTGLAPSKIDTVIGVAKTYVTRVGEGPFLTRMEESDEKKIVEKGAEYGSTTQRMRKCGYLDLPMLRYGCLVNGVKEIFLTKIDVLSAVNKIKIATKYIIDGQESEYYPFEMSLNVVPVYEEFDSFKGDISGVKNFSSLPLNAQKIVKFIEEKIETKISMLSIGEHRGKTLVL